MSTMREALREMFEMNAALFRAISAEGEVVQEGILDRLEAEQKKLGIEDGYGKRARAALAADEKGESELVAALREMKELFRFALTCTSPEIAKEGMAFVRKAETILSKHAPMTTTEG